MLQLTRSCKTPDYLSDVEAAAVPLTALTAEQALDILNLQNSDSSLFISGGSVMVMAIFLAAARGLNVTKWWSKSERAHKELGASQYFDYKTGRLYRHTWKDIDGAIRFTWR